MYHSASTKSGEWEHRQVAMKCEA